MSTSRAAAILLAAGGAWAYTIAQAGLGNGDIFKVERR